MELPKALDRPLYCINSIAVFWFLAFIVVGPKYTFGSSLLLLLAAILLPFNLPAARATLKEQAPWIIGLAVYTLYIVIYRALEGLPPSKLDPPFRLLAAIPILIHLRRYGFHPAAISLGAAASCLFGGGAGINEVLSGQAYRAGTTIAHHPIPYGTLVAMLAMCTLHAAATSRAGILQIAYFSCAAVGLAAVVLSGTRGLIPALALAVGYLGYRSLARTRMNKAKTATAAIAAAILIGFAVYQAPVVKYRIAETQAEIARLESGKLDSSFGIRLQMWHVALHLLAQDPLFGAGTGQEKRGAAAAEFMIEKNYDPSLFTAFDHLHSEYFDTLASYGLAGLGALLALLAGAVWRVPLPGRIPLVMVLAIVSIEALTETVFVDTKLTLGFVFLITALRARANNELAGTARTRFAYPPLPIPKNGL